METSLSLARQFLGKHVEVIFDRPRGSRHPQHGFIYEVNYGYIPNTTAPDGEPLDAYYLGVDQPLEQAAGVCIAIIHRLNDDDDKLVVVPTGLELADAEIEKQINFQEQFFQHEVLRA
jgi:inorganic pyrophosphatase